MRGIVVDRFLTTSELSLGTMPEPVCPEGGVLIDVAYAGVNFFDTLLIQGKYQEKPAFPFSPGGEVSGTVRAVGGGVTDVRVGDRVMAYVTHGGFAERVAADRSAVSVLPENVSLEDAAALPIVYGTAYAAVAERGTLRSGETALVTAASGGVGTAAVQVAKALGGKVIALAGGDKLDVARGAGADLALDYGAPTWIEEVRAYTGGRGVDVVVENVGGDVFEGVVKSIAWGGRIVVVGFSSGEIPELKLNRVLLKHISVVGLHFGPMRNHEPATFARILSELVALYEAGKIKPIISGVLPLASAGDALERIASRKSVGKIVLRV